MKNGVLSQFRTSIIFAIYLIFTCLSSIANCETLVINQVPFEIKSLRPVDDKSFKISLQDEATLISRDNLHDFVVKGVFSSKERTLSLGIEATSNFIRNSIDKKNIEWAGLALAALLDLKAEDIAGKKNWAGRSTTEVIQELSELASSSEVFKVALFDNRRLSYVNENLYALLYYLALDNLTWLRTSAISYVYMAGAEFKEYVEKRYFELIKAREYTRSKKVVELLLGLFGANDPYYLKVKSIDGRVDTFLESKSSANLDGVYQLLELAKSDKQFEEMFYAVISEYIHAQSSKYIKEQQPTLSLTALSQLDPMKRTPSTHELVLAILDQLPPSERTPIRDMRIQLLVDTIAKNDLRVKNAYLGFLERQLNYLFKKRHISEIDFCFAKLLELRPDPDRANDRMRLEKALVYLKSGLRNLAKEERSKIQTNIGIFAQLRLILAGYYVDAKVLLLLVLCVLLFIALRVRKRLAPVVESGPTDYQYTDETGQQFVLGGLRNMMSSKVEEYNRCIDLLGLAPEADVKSIKSAYRSAVKQAHPDMNHAGKSEDSERFIQITQAYERILELRKELGLPVE